MTQYFRVRVNCPACNEVIRYPPNVKPEVNSLFVCGNCNTYSKITEITDMGRGRLGIHFFRLTRAEVEEFERRGAYEDMVSPDCG